MAFIRKKLTLLPLFLTGGFGKAKIPIAVAKVCLSLHDQRFQMIT